MGNFRNKVIVYPADLYEWLFSKKPKDYPLVRISTLNKANHIRCR